MSGWMGNYSEREKGATFKPADDAPKLVTPGMAFKPDSGGGYGVVSVTGNLHDVLDKSAPAWFANIINSLANQKGTTKILVRRTGKAGKYNFWSLPAGVTSAMQLEQLTADEISASKARIAVELEMVVASRAASNDRFDALALAKVASMGFTHPVKVDAGVVVAQNEDGLEVIVRVVNGIAVNSTMPNFGVNWLPYQTTERGACADAGWWIDWSEADIEKGRALKLAKKAAQSEE